MYDILEANTNPYNETNIGINLNYILGIYIPTDNQFVLSDINQDEILNILDVVLLVNIILSI